MKWKLVPVEPTPEMVDHGQGYIDCDGKKAEVVFRSMCVKAPAPLDDAELVERVARVIDPKSWTDDLPIPTRTRVVSFHAGRLTSIKKARAAIAAMTGGE